MTTLPQCPVCCTELNLRADANVANPTEFKVSFEAVNSDNNYVIQCFFKYLAWVAQGQKEYHKDQYYYDTYHESVRWDEEEQVFKFHVQVFDSPDGDTWYRGKLAFRSGRIEIFDTKYESM